MQGKALTLEPENWEHIGRFPIGTAIVKIPDRWPKPFLVRFPEFPVLESVKDEIKKYEGDSLKQTVDKFQQAVN